MAQAALVVPAVRVVSEDPVEQVALVESEDPVEPAGQESPAAQVALVVSEDPAELVARESPAELVAPEGPAELVVLESPAELVVLESPAEPVVPERELVQVEAVPAREHPRARPAVALRTRSVTAAHRRGLVPLLGAEDLVAAAAETTRERAAAEVVIAWEVAE